MTVARSLLVDPDLGKQRLAEFWNGGILEGGAKGDAWQIRCSRRLAAATGNDPRTARSTQGVLEAKESGGAVDAQIN